MDYMQHPYFTDQNVEKEKGIIGQEINMYNDYPEWQVYMNAIKLMYHNLPIKIDIAGTAQSIAEIDKEILYKCYNTFYHPSNMVMCIAGDFEPENLIEEVKKRLIPKENVGKIKRIFEKEDETIVKKEEIKKMEVSMPIFVIGIKDKPLKGFEEEDIIKRHIAIEILLNLAIGKSSILYKNLYEKGLLMSEPYLEYEFDKTYSHIAITGKSKEPKRILEGIFRRIEEIKKAGINKDDFERVRKMLYGTSVKTFDDVENICRNFVNDYFKGINSFNYIENYQQISVEYAKQILDEVFREDKTVISIVN